MKYYRKYTLPPVTRRRTVSLPVQPLRTTLSRHELGELVAQMID